MKTLFMAVIAIALAVHAGAQTQQSPYPCLRTFTIANLGNNPTCPSTYEGFRKTGLIEVSFTSVVPPDVMAPKIVSLARVDENGNIIEQYPVKLVFKGFGSTNYTAEYCFYTESGDNVISASNNYKYKATIQYEGFAVASCDVVNAPPPSTLPVKFKQFSAAKNGSSVSLTWTTSAEIDNKGFYVQRYADGTWKDLQFVASKAPDGQSSTDIDYSYTDMNEVRGIVQYRIRQEDLNGKYSFSEIRLVKESSSGIRTTVYPNPSKGAVSIIMERPDVAYEIQVIEMSGRVVKTFTGVKVSQQVSGLGKGQYLARITEKQSGTSTTEKFVIQ